MDWKFNEKEDRVKGSLAGTVETVTQKEDKISVLVSNALFLAEGEKTPCKLNKILFDFDKILLYPGNRIKLEGSLLKFQKPSNPGEFHTFYYYKSKGITYRMKTDSVYIWDKRINYFRYYLEKCRSNMIKVYRHWLPKKEAALLSAMFFGEKTDLPEEIKNLYQRNGIGHLLAISGLHISLIGRSVYQIGLWLLKRKKVSAWLGMLTVFLYAFMTGFSISANRAVMMTIISFIAILIGRTYDMLSAASLSAVFILVFHPLEIRNSGFLLSFGAILGISILYPQLLLLFETSTKKKRKSKVILEELKKSVLLSIAIQLVTFPMVLYSFYEYPLYGILLNLFVLPLMPLLAGMSVTASLCGCLWMGSAGIFMGGILAVLSFYEKAASFFDKLPFASVIIGKPVISYYLLYYAVLGGVFLLLFLFKKKRLLLFLLLLILIPVRPRNPGLRVVFLDVGQGDGIYIETREKLHILIDGGSSNKSRLGEFVLLPFLKSQGCQKLDYIFLSHLDEDHISGVNELLEQSQRGEIKIGMLVLAQGVVRDEAFEKMMLLLKQVKVPVRFIKRNQNLHYGKLNIHCVGPGGEQNEDRNESSMALEVFYGDFSMLLTGDMEKAEEEVLPFLKKEQYTVLKVGHHGSKTSTGETFLNRVRPQYAVISCAAKNRYGHPDRGTLERLKSYKCKILYTKKGGAIRLKTNGIKLGLDYFKDS